MKICGYALADVTDRNTLWHHSTSQLISKSSIRDFRATPSAGTSSEMKRGNVQGDQE
jgi:hypothetical protein